MGRPLGYTLLRFTIPVGGEHFVYGKHIPTVVSPRSAYGHLGGAEGMRLGSPLKACHGATDTVAVSKLFGSAAGGGLRFAW